MKVKPRRTISWFLENGILYLYLIFVILHVVTWGLFDINYFGINRTVGWFYDLKTTFNIFYYSYSMPLFFGGLLVLTIFKKKTNRRLSAMFLILLVLLSILGGFLYSFSLGHLKVITFLMFALLFFEAITRKSEKNK